MSTLAPTSISFVDGRHRTCGGPWKREQARDEQCPGGRWPLTGCQPMVLCPDGCGRWVYVQRGKLKPHHAPYQKLCPGRGAGEVRRPVRCPGSNQRIKVDLTRDEHLALLYKVHLERAE